MKIASRNVNGIRSIIEKWFYDWVATYDFDIICLQEVKSFETQLPSDFRYYMQAYDRVWHAWTRPGYAWVATLYKKHLLLVSKTSTFDDIEVFHEDGRVVETTFHNFTLLNLYFPNGGERADGTEMLSYKLAFYDRFIAYLDYLKQSKKFILTCGDFNICHREIDIARPKENEHSIWFLPVERQKLDLLEEHGYVDVFRYFYPDAKDQYTWWSFRAGARPRNVWWRLDYFWVSPEVIPFIKNITHQTQVMWSDHCPVVIELDW